MLKAFGRLIFIALNIVTWTVLTVFGLRTCGGNQTYAEFQHPLWDHRPWVIAMGGDDTQNPRFSKAAYDEALAKNPNVILGASIRLTQDGQWIVYAEKTLKSISPDRGFVSQTTLENIKKNQSNFILTFEEWVDLYGEHPLWIEVLQPANSSLSTIYAVLRKNSAERRVVLTSPFLDTLKDMRKQSAQWLTGTSVSETAKTQLMASIFLETLLTLDGDVYTSPHISERLLPELMKRKKIVLLETNDADEYTKLLSSSPLLGVLTSHPANFKSFTR